LPHSRCRPDDDPQRMLDPSPSFPFSISVHIPSFFYRCSFTPPIPPPPISGALGSRTSIRKRDNCASGGCVVPPQHFLSGPPFWILPFIPSNSLRDVFFRVTNPFYTSVVLSGAYSAKMALVLRWALFGSPSFSQRGVVPLSVFYACGSKIITAHNPIRFPPFVIHGFVRHFYPPFSGNFQSHSLRLHGLQSC